MREAARLLRRDGRLVVAHFDWLPARRERRRGDGEGDQGAQLALAARRRQRHAPALAARAAEAGYRDLESFSYDVEVPYTHAGWRGRVRASSAGAASASARRVQAIDRALARLLADEFPGDEFVVPHRCCGRRAPSACRDARRPAPALGLGTPLGRRSPSLDTF
jgi:hypothetical protein